MEELPPKQSLVSWTRVFAETLLRLFPHTDLVDALEIAHGRYFADEGLEPVQAAELYALSDGNPAVRRDGVSRERQTFRGLTERFMNGTPGLDAFRLLESDARTLGEIDPNNDDIYACVAKLAAQCLVQLQTGDLSGIAARTAHGAALRACFRLLVALSAERKLRANTVADVKAEFGF